MSTLDTGVKFCRNVPNYSFGAGNIESISRSIERVRSEKSQPVVYFVDHYFKESNLLSSLVLASHDVILWVDSSKEPTTSGIDDFVATLSLELKGEPCAVVGIGGGCTLDTAKAVSNLLTNGGKAANYQGWDLVKVPGIHKIGVPTISGTGAEATRTCVMTNTDSGLKLGMNSDFTVYNEIILDPDLTKTVPKEQYFYTGMDAYIHCIESLAGSYRNAVGDAFSRETLNLCREVFAADDMQSDENREKLMVASYLGGCAIASSYVGLIHPFSAGLSVVLGHHHCVANCITMRAMSEFYPQEYDEFWGMVEKQGINIPSKVACDLTDEQYRSLYDATIVHEKPLTNALGPDFKSILTLEKVTEMFKKM